jgi:hypothetical protein
MLYTYKFSSLIRVLLIVFSFSGCFDQPPDAKFQISSNFIIIDYSENNQCIHPVVISINNHLLFLQRDTRTYGYNNNIPTPKFYRSGAIIVTNECKILIEICAFTGGDCDYSAYYPETPYPIPVEIDFKILNPLTNAEAHINSEFNPHFLPDSTDCKVNGVYEYTEYNQLYTCINNLTPHATLELLPPQTSYDWDAEFLTQCTLDGTE